MQEMETVAEAAFKLVLAAGLSSVIGIERERKGRAAGLRTHVLVCLGATLAMVISDVLADEWRRAGVPIWLDRGRIAAGILTGVGFLGAGTIINVGGTHRGLTTAAMVWFVAAQGIAVGAGYYVIAAVATAMVLVIVVGLEWVEDRLPSAGVYFLTLELPHEAGRVGEVKRRIEQEGYIAYVHRVKHQREEHGIEMVFEVSRISPDAESLVDSLHQAYPTARRIDCRR